MSSEKTDMDGLNRADRAVTAEFPLRCVWTSYPHKDESCRSRIPARTVAAAWRRELETGRTHAGFFQFVWRGQMWLAYGLSDGSVRGVYCPVHRAERAERLGYDPELAVTAAGHAS